MTADFSVPKEFEEYSRSLYAKESITEREFVDFCLLATSLVQNHWNNRQGFAYHITGAWLKYKNIEKDDLLDQIGATFGQLELPDGHIAASEEGVRREWDNAKKLVVEASNKVILHPCIKL